MIFIAAVTWITFYDPVLLRFFSAFLLGYILKLIYFNFELLTEPFQTLITLEPLPTEFWPWLYYQAINLLYIFFIVCIMVIILEILKKIGIERLFEIIFIPPLKLFGIQKEAMNIIIVGMTIGIQYGGGMLIKDVKSGKIDRQSDRVILHR